MQHYISYHSDLLQYQQSCTGRSIQFKTCSLVITSLAFLLQIGLKESGNSWLADSLARNWINPQWCEMYPKVLMGLKSHCGAPKISQNSVSPLARYSSIHCPAFEYHSCDLWWEKAGFQMEERNGLSKQPYCQLSFCGRHSSLVNSYGQGLTGFRVNSLD